jgi:cytochrome c peroxidase
MYNGGMPQPKRKESQANDTLFPTTSRLIQKLKLNQSELNALEAFISSLSTGAYKMRPPELPQ